MDLPNYIHLDFLFLKKIKNKNSNNLYIKC